MENYIEYNVAEKLIELSGEIETIFGGIKEENDPIKIKEKSINLECKIALMRLFISEVENLLELAKLENKEK